MIFQPPEEMPVVGDRLSSAFDPRRAKLPKAPDVRLRDTDLGDVPALEVTIAWRRTRGTILWLHGGAFVARSARAAPWARRTWPAPYGRGCCPSTIAWTGASGTARRQSNVTQRGCPQCLPWPRVMSAAPTKKYSNLAGPTATGWNPGYRWT